MRLSIGLIVWFGPPIFGLLFGWDVMGLLRAAWDGGGYPTAAGYVAVCLCGSSVCLPIATIIRQMRKPPAAVLEELTETFDVANELGFRPVGDSKYRHLTSVPFNRPFHVDFTTLTLALPELPAAWDGLSILHLSDLHFIGTPAAEYFEWVFDKCMADGEPDLLCVTGDIVDTNRHIEWIVPLLSRLRWREGAFAILGNHDYWQDSGTVRKRLESLGIREVGNQVVSVELRGEPLMVIGHEGPWFRPGPDERECCGNGFRLCLSHTPDNIGWCRRNGVQLMLSGHNHGGQIRLPVFGSIFVPSKYSRRYDMGTFFEPPTLLHVNRGMAGKEPLRFNCNAQVTRIILRREQ